MRIPTGFGRLCSVILFTGLLTVPLGAAVMTYSGHFNLSNPNEVFKTILVVTTPSDITVQTYSYGGGIMRDGTVVPSGSFDPTVTLFEGSGPGAIFRDPSYFNDDGTCPPAIIDPGTLLCLDSVLNIKMLAAGKYTIVLTVAGNTPLAVSVGSGTLGDGFEGHGLFDEPPVGRYVLEVVTIPVPEPQTMTFIGLASIALWCRTSWVARRRYSALPKPLKH